MLTGIATIGALTRLEFGGEDILEDADDFDNWHHRGISNEAALQSGWSAAAAAEVSWHADYVDSYLYNPLWWVGGGLSRVKTALSLAPVLTNVHFDDLNSIDQVRVMWRRYLSGTTAGVYWAAEHGDSTRVAAARHIVGVALHAVQDFYSHSNWVDDPARRSVIWSELSEQQQESLALYTGTYEGDEHTGIHHHGKYSVGCTVLQPAAPLMNVLCHAASPFSNTAVCEIWRSCDDAVPIGSFEVLGVPVPENLVYLDPPGIALDNTWLAQIGAQQRGFTREDGEVLFTAARSLAVRESCAFLATLRSTMERAGEGEFWRQVESGPVFPQSVWEDQYEDFHRQGLHFIGTGTYPPSPRTPEHEWFLRLRIRTGSGSGSGTDADVYAVTDQGRFKLDTMAGANPLIAYNDFEAGDDQVYHIGPFRRLPSSVGLFNDSADAGEVFEALGRAFLDALRGAAHAAVDFLLSIIGGHADHVDTNDKTWSPGELRTVGSGPQAFSVRLNGRSEGDFTVHGTIARTRRWISMGRPVSDYRVHLDRLHCREESDWDRGSNSDEPFLYTMLINQAARTIDSHQFGPYEDVDSGDDRSLGHALHARGVPDNIGYLTLPIQLMESDDEGAGRRRQGFDRFRRTFTEATEPNREGFIAALGRSLGADWNVAGFEVDAYRTGDDEIVSGRVLHAVRPGWITGDATVTYPLSDRDLTTIQIERATCGDRADQVGGVDFEGDGRNELFARSPWGVGVLGFERAGLPSRSPSSGSGLSPAVPPRLTIPGIAPDLRLPPVRPSQAIGRIQASSPAMAANGTMLNGWRINTDDNRFGPAGDFNGDRRSSVLARSPWGIGVLSLQGDRLAASMVAANDTWFGGWRLNTDDNRFGPVGDFNGDGTDELVVTSPWGLGLLRLDRAGADPLVVAANGTPFGGWLLNTDDNRFGPVGDFTGHGSDQLFVASPWGIGLLSLEGSVMGSVAMAGNGTRIGGWLVNTADNRFGPVGDFDGDGRAEVVVRSPWGIGIIGVKDNAFELRYIAANKTRIGEWMLNTGDNEIHAAGAFTGDRDQLFVTSPWGAGVLGQIDGTWGSLAMAPNGTSIDGWNLQTADNRFAVCGPVGEGAGANIVVTSNWGLGILGATDQGFSAEYLARNGTRLGQWLLNTDDNRLT